MDDRETYFGRLTEALQKKSEYLETTSVRRLREHIQGIESGVSTIYNFLLEKGQLQNDPYKQERTVTQIQVPPTGSITEADLVQEISLRFSQYVSQWEFLVNLFHVSLTDLSLKRIKKIMELLDWIKWTDFSVNSPHQITRAIADMTIRLTRLEGSMTGRIITSTTSHLRDLTGSTKKELKTLSIFLRERYKWRVREEVTGQMKIDEAQYRRNSNEVLSNIKFEFSHKLRGTTWYKELIEELLDEDFGEDPDPGRNAVLERLAVDAEPVKTKRKTGPDEKALLLSICEKMARGAEPMRNALGKLNDNARTIKERKRSFGERLSEMFSNLFGREDDSAISIPIVDGVSGAIRYEKLDHQRFSAETLKRSRSLQGLQNPQSSLYKNARNAENAVLLGYIEKNIAAMKSIHRKLVGLDSYFQSDAVPKELQSSMKRPNLSIKNLKTAISDSMKALNDYKSRTEIELKQLGIEA